MKPFAVWLAIALAAFAGLSGGYHLYLEHSPRRVTVLVDTSYPMRASWPAAAAHLRAIESERYTEFSLFTEKGRVHGWKSRLRPGDIAPYAPRDLDGLSSPRAQSEFDEADERILITNANPDELPDPSGWDVMRLAP